MEHTRSSSGDGEQDRGFMSRVRERASEQLNTQKNHATEGIGSAATAVRQSTQKLREERHETVAQYIESAADQLDRFASRLKDKNVSELVGDAQRFARRQPAMFIGGAFALGLLGSRFLKSSDPDGRASRSWEDGGYARTQFDRPTYGRAAAVGTSGPSSVTAGSTPSGTTATGSTASSSRDRQSGAGPANTGETIADKATGRRGASPARRPSDG